MESKKNDNEALNIFDTLPQQAEKTDSDRELLDVSKIGNIV